MTPNRPDATCLIALRVERAIRARREALRVFAAFAGITAPANGIHGDGNRLVHLFAERAERHRAGGEPFEDCFHRFDFVKWNRRLRFEIKQAPDDMRPLVLRLTRLENSLYLP